MTGGRHGLGPVAGGQLDHLQRHRRQARLAVLTDRSRQVLDQHRRAFAQRDRHQVVAHHVQQALDVVDQSNVVTVCEVKMSLRRSTLTEPCEILGNS